MLIDKEGKINIENIGLIHGVTPPYTINCLGMGSGKLKIILILSFSLIVGYSTSQIIKKQVIIPLNNLNGVPYNTNNEMRDYSIDGFDIDSSGQYYFVGGNPIKGTTVLVVFKDAKVKYRKIYKDYFANKLFIYSDTLYLFDNNHPMNNVGFVKNDLYELNKENGMILKKHSHIIENTINSYECIDSLIVLWIIDKTKGAGSYFFALINLNGKLIGKAENQNRFNVPDSITLKNEKNVDAEQYLGQWNKLNLFWGFELIKVGPNGYGNYKFYFKDIYGKTVGCATMPDSLFGRNFYETPDEDRKLRNGAIYILGRKSKNALITELSVEELYKDALLHKE